MEKQQVDTVVLPANLNRLFFAEKGKILAQFEYKVAHSPDKCPAEIILMEGIRQIEEFHHLLIKERILL